MGMTLAQAKSAMFAKASSSGLTAPDVAKLKLTPYTSETLHVIKGLPQYLGCFSIPYFDLNGKVTKFLRVRYTEPPSGFAALIDKPMRYAQPAGTTNEVYFPPLAPWKAIAANTEDDLVITEGELKAACATKMKIPTIGLGGVNMFSDYKHGNFVLPSLSQVNWEGRNAFVIFDSDAATNPNVLRAESMLCRELLRLGAYPFIVRLPKLGDGKTGLDDFLVAGDQAVDILRDMMSNAEPYESAKALHKMNECVVYVKSPDIVFEPKDSLHMRTDKFVTSYYANYTHMAVGSTGQARSVSTASEWLKWEHRSEVLNFTYEPGGEYITADKKLNLWRDWPYQPVKGDVSMWHRVMDHLFKDTEPQNRVWFEKWVAYPLQHPGAKLKTAVMMWGGQGVGKSFVAETIMRLYGDHNATKFGNVQLSSSFNSWAEHKQFAVGEEIVIHSQEKRSMAEMLKTLITDTTISIRRLYLNAYTLPNCMNMMLLSNHPTSLKLEEDDRRYFVHHVKSGKMLEDLYVPFDKWSKSEKGLSALFHYFLTLDLTGFDPQAAALQTADRYGMISGSRSELAEWVAQLRLEPDSVLKLGKAEVRHSLFSLEELYQLFKSAHERTMITKNTLGAELAAQKFAHAYPGVIRTCNGSKRLWMIRYDERFKGFTPTQFGEFYDAERGHGSKSTKATIKKGSKY